MRLYLTAGYYLHSNHLSGMIKYALDNIDKPLIASSEFVDALGIGPRNVEGLRVVLVEMGILNSRKFTLTTFGKYVALHDPYFDNLSTLWISHFNISANPDNFVWHRFSKEIFSQVDNFTHEDIYSFYPDVADFNKGRSAHKTMHKEVKALLDAYSTKVFKNLKLLIKDNKSRFYKGNPSSVDPVAFLYCLLRYIENKKIIATALPVPEILSDKDSPAQLLFLDEIAVSAILNSLHSHGFVSLEKFADLNQVRFPNTLSYDSILVKIYGGIS